MSSPVETRLSKLSAPCLVQEIGRISPAVFQQPVPVIIGDGIDPIQGITNCLRQPVVDGRGPELTCRGATGDDEEKGLVEAAIREAAFKGPFFRLKSAPQSGGAPLE